MSGHGGNDDEQLSIERRVQELEDYCNPDNVVFNRLSLEGVREKIRGIPPADVRESHFFTLACENGGVTLEIIECLLAAFPGADRLRSYLSPLHWACMNQKNMDPRIVQLLLDRWPESVHLTSHEGDLPLHYLARNADLDEESSVEILNLLLAAVPQSVAAVGQHGYLPIHEAAESGKSHSFCKRLIDANPESLRVQTVDCMALPIHFACNGGNVETVKYMVELYPEGIGARCGNGDLPIHWAACSDGGHKGEIIKYLLAKDPDCASKTGDDRRLPLHMACEYDCLESVRLLFDAYPEALCVQTADGWGTPLDIARNEEMEVELIEFLEEQLAYAHQAEDSGAMCTPDQQGWLPLHQALQNNASLGACAGPSRVSELSSQELALNLLSAVDWRSSIGQY